MKQATDCFEQLLDAFSYSVSSWLRLDLQGATRAEALNILGGASYLFDNLFAKEDAGSEITRAVYEEDPERYDPKALSGKATAIRLAMDKRNYESGGTPFRDYYQWLLPSEPELSYALLDQAGLLCLATMDALIALLSEQNKECAPLRIAEVIFLNFTRAFERILKSHYGESFASISSSRYFASVEEEFSLIRSSIED